MGSKTFLTQARLAYSQGARVRATSRGSGYWMEGVVTSYIHDGTTGTLVLNVDLINGSGSHDDWNFNLAGEPQFDHEGDITFATASLTNDSIESGSFNFGSKSAEIYRISVSALARIRLYSTAAGRDSDVSRLLTSKAPWNSGLQAEWYLNTTSLLNFKAQPVFRWVNMDSPRITTCYYNITNISGSTQAITVTISRLRME